jgi:dTMP kinase
LEDRAWDVENNILPALGEGRPVVIDRYILSNVAYQGARGLMDPESILKANSAFPQPDLTFLLELDPSSGLGRISSRGALDAAFETEGYLNKVKAVYDSLRFPGLIRLSASPPREDIHRLVLSAVRALDSGPAGGPA